MADRPKLPEGPSGKSFAVHPAGAVAIVLADVVDLGFKVDTPIGGGDPFPVPKAALVFQSTKINPDTEKPFEPWVEVTMSYSPKSNLRKLLDSWLGQAHTDEQAKSLAATLDTLVGRTGLGSVVHKATQKGRTFARLQTVMPLPDGMPSPAVRGYTRSKWWTEKKEEYAKGYAEYVQKLANKTAKEAETLADFPAALAGDGAEEDLPF